MPKFIIERELPGAGNISQQELEFISQKSCTVISTIGQGLQWIESYVTDNKIYCVYLSPSESLIKEHASQGGFPANTIQKVKTVISPITAEA